MAVVGADREFLIRRTARKPSVIFKKIRGHLKFLFPYRNDRKILGQALQIYVRRVNGGSREYRKPREVDGKFVLDRRCEMDPLAVNAIRGSTILDNLDIWDDENDRIQDLKRIRDEFDCAQRVAANADGASEASG